MDIMNLMAYIVFSMAILQLPPLLYTYVYVANPAKRGRWKKWSIETNIDPKDFISKVQNICLARKFTLLEISPIHAYIRGKSGFSRYGSYFYIELSDSETPIVTVYGRGAFRTLDVRLEKITDIANLMM